MLEGAGLLRVDVASEGPSTWVQVGHALDTEADYATGDEVTWSEPLQGGGRFDIPVPAGAFELPPQERWAFFVQYNLPKPATQDCYTGFAEGRVMVRIQALPT